MKLYLLHITDSEYKKQHKKERYNQTIYENFWM